MKKADQKKVVGIAKKLGRKSYWLGILIVLAVVVANYVEDNKPKTSEQGNIELVKCVDGDTATFRVEGKEEKVRFLAIDTPETVKPNTPVQPYGKEASDLTCSLLSDAAEIKFEYEDANKTDKYDRLLAWVWVDGQLLQRELISKGYAEVKYIYGDYRYTDELYELQEKAKSEGVGRWK